MTTYFITTAGEKIPTDLIKETIQAKAELVRDRLLPEEGSPTDEDIKYASQLAMDIIELVEKVKNPTA